MEVQVREKCDECENGVVQSHPWDVFAGEEGEATRKHADDLRAHGHHGAANEHELAWFRERGWTVIAKGYGETFPNEEEPCPECEGASHMIRWVPIDELPLAVEVRRLRMGLSALDGYLLEMGERS